MQLTSRTTNIRNVRQGDPKFTLIDGFVTCPRAGFEISQSCPAEYKSIFITAINEGFIAIGGFGIPGCNDCCILVFFSGGILGDSHDNCGIPGCSQGCGGRRHMHVLPKLVLPKLVFKRHGIDQFILVHE